jgi:acetolactate synthase I/II/III large subunit
LERAIAAPGPHLIEAVVPSMFTPFQLKAMPYALKALAVLPRPVSSAVKRRLAP